MERQNSIPAKVIIVVLIIVLLFIGLFLLLPKKYPVECSLEATEIERGDPANRKQITLMISGTYKSSLLGGDSFVGKIEIEGLPATTGEMLPITFDPQDKNYGSLNYRNNDSAEFIGYIRMDKKASDIIICLFEDVGDGMVWGQDEGYIIMYPYDDLNEIQDMLY